ncbi:MAG: AI-2E family transporter, partial [Chloroflexota bacterium]
EFFDAKQDRRLRSYGIRAWSWIGILLLTVMLYMGITAFSGFVIPLIVAVVLGMVFEPVAGLLGRIMPRQLASLLVLIGLVALAVVAIGVVVIGIIDQGPEIVEQMQVAIDRLREWLTERGIEFGADADLRQQVTSSLDDVVPGLLSYVPSAFSGIITFFASTFIALFILYFMLAEWDSLAGWVGANLGVPADLGEGIVADATRSFRDYFYVLTISSIPVAVTVGVAAWLMGIPLAFTIGLITFITSYVPYLGALVSSVFALLIAFGSGGPLAALIILIVILVAQNMVQPVIQRALERSALDLHPIVSFGSTITGSVLFGILGATLSAPTVAMVLRVRQRVQAFQAGDPSTAAAGLASSHDATDEAGEPGPDSEGEQ